MLLCAYIQRHVLCEDDLACQPLIALVGRTGVQLCQQETCLHAHLGSLDTTKVKAVNGEILVCTDSLINQV